MENVFEQERGQLKGAIHMAMKRFLPRLLLCSWFLFICASCSQSSNIQTQQQHPSQQQHPLHLPVVKPGASCPTTPEKTVTSSFGIAQGKGPVYATLDTTTIASPAVLNYADASQFGSGGSGNQGWGGQKVLWFIDPNYQGLVLIRGHQLDGVHEMRFGTTLDQQLVFDTSTSGGSPWPNFPSYTRLQAPGCYAYQVDGNNFSYVIVFQAIPLKV